MKWFRLYVLNNNLCLIPQVGRLENAIGWYHSHPGYGCWLSGIDVSTQMLNQQFQEPFVAVVVRQEILTIVISSQTHGLQLILITCNLKQYLGT